MMVLPISLENCIYTPFYCEENIYKLLESLDENTRKECYVVFISNDQQKTPLWQQRIGRSEEDHIVFWDYHVILIHHCPSPIDPLEPKSYVYDFDTILPFPVPFSRYYNGVFKPGILKDKYTQQFRLVHGPDYLACFSSDRSRMKRPDGTFMEPPPKYLCIKNGDVDNNLNDFISMTPDFECGTVLSLTELHDRFS